MWTGIKPRQIRTNLKGKIPLQAIEVSVSLIGGTMVNDSKPFVMQLYCKFLFVYIYIKLIIIIKNIHKINHGTFAATNHAKFQNELNYLPIKQGLLGYLRRLNQNRQPDQPNMVQWLITSTKTSSNFATLIFVSTFAGCNCSGEARWPCHFASSRGRGPL
jgi:hypothetical protein